MPIEITLKNVGPRRTAGGVLDPEQVLVRYRTQNDDHVRASHAALEGKIFRLDEPGRPSPPLDWGCRCFLEYVAAPDSMASQVLPEEADSEPTTPQVAFAEYLDGAVGHDVWRKVAKAVLKVEPGKRLHTALGLLLKVLAKERRSDARELARMIVEADRG